MGKLSSLSGKERTRLIVSVACLPVIAAAGVALVIGNSWAFGDGASTMNTYLTTPAPADTSAMTRSSSGMGDELAVEVEGEGIVMLENNGTLPLSKDTVKKVNVFGHGSVDWYIMSSGSEMVGTKGHKSYDFNSALEKRGIEVNPNLPAYYKDWHKAEGDSNTIMTSLDSYFVIREPSLEVDSKYQELYEEAKAYSDTAFFVISRHAGENSDCPHYQNKLSSSDSTHKSGSTVKDEERDYLEISTEEEYALRQIAADFENVIVIENSTNNMTLDFVKNINDEIPDGIDAVLNVGVTGGQGALAIPDVVFGTVTPSGHMTDTTPYRPEYNITYYRSCAKHTRHYEGGKSSDFFSKAGRGSGGAAFYNYACYTEYTEGIYMGYRWFETADAEGFWDQDPYNGYDNVVQYPFGYGMSYTDFSWKLVEAKKVSGSEIEADEKLTFRVEVTNTGEYKGKDVVQIYLTAPYTPGGIEKSYRKLVGYEKTPLLKPGEVCTIDIEVDTKDFKSYDDYDANSNGHTGYELEAGDYVLNFMTDAHHVKENMSPVTYKVSNTVMIDKDEVTGETVENRFTGDTAYEGMPIDGSSVDQNIEFVHRNNFPALLTDCEPNKPWTDKLMDRLSDPEPIANYSYSKTMSDTWDNATTDYWGDPVPAEAPTWNSGGDAKLMENGQLTEIGMACGEDYDAEEWNGVLDQLDFDNSKKIVTENSNYAGRGMTEIGLRDSNNASAFKFEEGAAMIGGGLGQNDEINCPAYPGPTMGCQAWNRALTYKLGKSMGNDMNASGADGIFSPNCNLHRSTYGGRNCGYQSEDPILSGRYVSEIIKGISIYGRMTFVKHFVANDQDFNRMANMAWMTEQTFRELYLRSFEEAVKNGGTVGIMTSFNRIGGLWTGGNEALIQGVLRREWGFRGQIITDMTENKTNMDIGFSFRYGGNLNLGGGSTVANAIGTAATTPVRVQWRLREAMHEIAYAYCHAMWRNATYNESADPSEAIVSIPPKDAYLWWQPALVSIDAFAFSGLAIGAAACVLTILNTLKNGGEEAEENE